MPQILDERLPPERLLECPGFLKLATGRLIGTIAMQIQAVVVAWHLYDLTHDPLALGYVGLVQFLPMAAFTLPAGDLADRFDRRLLLALAWLIQALAAITLFLLTLTEVNVLWPFYAALMLFGVGRAFAGPSMQSLLPLVVPKKLLPQGIAWNSAAFQVAVIAGPALGGMVYLLGAGFAFGLCAIMFFIGAISIYLINVQNKQQINQAAPSALERLKEGVSYVRHRPIVLGALSLDLFAVLLGGATALLPIYAKDILHVGPGGLGALRSAMAIGAFGMGILLGYLSIKRHAGMVMFVSVALFGVATVVFALSTNFVLSLVALFIIGASDMVSVFVRASLIQMATPDAMRGRVSAVNMLFIGASNELGEFESGTTAAWFGTVPAAIIGGVGTVVVVGLWMWWFPALRKVDRLSDVTS